MQRSSASVSQQQLNAAHKMPTSQLEQYHNSEQHKHQHVTACKRHAPPPPQSQSSCANAIEDIGGVRIGVWLQQLHQLHGRANFLCCLQ
jgi:hypothetical protein